MSLHLIASSSSSSKLVVVVEISLIGSVDSLLWRQLVDPLSGLIRRNVLSILLIKPVISPARSLHLDWAQLGKIPLVSGNEEDSIVVLVGERVWRMEYGEPDLGLLPSVVQLNKLLKAAVHVLPSLSEVDALRIMSESFEISESVKAIFDIHSFVGFVVNNDEFVGEEPFSGSDWLDGLPSVGV